MNVFRAEYQIVVVRTTPGDGPVCSNRRPAVVAMVVAEAPENVAGVLTSSLSLNMGESVDIVDLRRVNSLNQKVYVADPVGREEAKQNG
jgi:hypothetical protein